MYRNNLGVFTLFWERLRAVIGRDDTEEAIKDILVEIYHEFNAPLPEELITQISDGL